MPTTPTYALPYPAPTDPADVPADIQRLANRINAVFIPGLVQGQVPYWNTPTATWLPGPALANYTPAWTSDGTAPALGNGTLAGRYTRVGAWVFCTLTLTFGSTTTFGTGTYYLSLPVAPEGGACQGVGKVVDSSAGIGYICFPEILYGGASMRILYITNAQGAGGVIGNGTGPMGALGAGDQLTTSLHYLSA